MSSTTEEDSRPNPWTTPGESISLSSAKDRYGLTEKQIWDSNLEFRASGHQANTLGIVVRFKTADIETLVERLKDEREISNLGSGEAYVARNAAERKRVQQKAEERRKKDEVDRQKNEFVKKYITILKLVQRTTAPIPKSLKGMKLKKTSSKKAWRLSEGDMYILDEETQGRSMMYKVTELIERAEEKCAKQYQFYNRTFAPLSSEIKDPDRKAIYVRYLLEKLERELKNSVVCDIEGEIREMALQRLGDNVTEASAEVTAATKKLEDNQALLFSFDKIFPTVFINPHPNPQANAQLERPAKVPKTGFIFHYKER